MSQAKLTSLTLFLLGCSYHRFYTDSNRCKLNFGQTLHHVYNVDDHGSHYILHVGRNLVVGGRLHLLGNIEEQKSMNLKNNPKSFVEK